MILGSWSLAAGRTDYTDPDDVRSFQELSARVATLLADHARNEDEHVLPLLERAAPGASADAHREHEDLEAELAPILAAIEALDCAHADQHDLYLAITQFQAHYLLHLVEEERVIEPALWKHYTDEELLADEAEVVQDIPFDLLLQWFAVCVPARTIAENRQVLAGVRSAVPAEAFEQIVEALRPVSSPERLSAMLAP